LHCCAAAAVLLLAAFAAQQGLRALPPPPPLPPPAPAMPPSPRCAAAPAGGTPGSADARGCGAGSAAPGAAAPGPGLGLLGGAPSLPGPPALFSFTLYAAKWEASAPAHSYDADSRVDPATRLLIYGGGLLANLEALRELWPAARAVVYYCREDEAAARHAPTEAFVARLERGWAATLEVVRCAPGDAPLRAGVTARGTKLQLGQAMRLTRYLPLLGAAGAGEPLALPVVVRDADSVLTALDVAIVQRWILAGDRDLLVYHEFSQALAEGWIMGGGIAARRSIAGAAAFLVSAAAESFDEGALRAALRPHLRRACLGEPPAPPPEQPPAPAPGAAPTTVTAGELIKARKVAFPGDGRTGRQAGGAAALGGPSPCLGGGTNLRLRLSAAVRLR